MIPVTAVCYLQKCHIFSLTAAFLYENKPYWHLHPVLSEAAQILQTLAGAPSTLYHVSEVWGST